MGHAPIAEFLPAQGAPLAIPTAAIRGRRADAERLLAEDPARSGDADLVRFLHERGARAGASMALAHAAQAGHLAVARWLLKNARPDLNWKNGQGKTALTLAEAAGAAEVAELIRGYTQP